MIVTKKSWIGLIFTLRGTALSRIPLRLAVTVGVATIITVLHESYGYFKTSLTPLPFSLVGLAIGVFLGFRNNTSYDRYWEGRKLWGQLVNTSRSLCRQILTLIAVRDGAPPSALQRELVHRVTAYVHCLRLHLRDEEHDDHVERLLPKDETEALGGESNRPIAVLFGIGTRLAAAFRRGEIDALHLAVFEQSLTNLTDIQGGCERIKSTPIPFSYTVLIHRIVAAYCFALPFGITDSVGILTPVVVFIVAFSFFGLDAIGEEIEQPFGTDRNDLPLLALSTMVENNLLDRLGEPAPKPIEPVEGVLL